MLEEHVAGKRGTDGIYVGAKWEWRLNQACELAADCTAINA